MNRLYRMQHNPSGGRILVSVGRAAVLCCDSRLPAGGAAIRSTLRMSRGADLMATLYEAEYAARRSVASQSCCMGWTRPERFAASRVMR